MVVNTRKLQQSPEWAAMMGTLLAAMAAHGFALFNILHNYDNILQQPNGYGAGVTSGRWLLSLLGDFIQNRLHMGYNLTTINGLLYIVLIAVSAAFVVNYLEIRNKVSSALVGCLMATFPTVGATMIFRFTAPYYGISLLLSVLAAWIVEKKRFGVILSAVCLAFSMGIYQAYPPVTISLFVLVLLRDALKEDAGLTKLIRRGVLYCAALALGVALYFLCSKLTLALYAVELDTYQGISSMGKISLSRLPRLLLKAWFSAALFSVRDYCDLAATPLLRISWTLLIVLILVLVAYILLKKKTMPLLATFCVLMGLLFPLAVNFIVIMCPDSTIYTIMVYSFVLIGCAPFMLLECLPKQTPDKNRLLSRIAGILAAVVVFCNSYDTNLNYTAIYYANRQVENYFSGLFAQMRMTEGYTPEKTWVFLGDQIQDRKFYNIWNLEPIYGGFVGNSASGLLNASYSVNTWIHNYIGYETCYADTEVEKMLLEDPRVMEMPCWPSQGSIQVVDDYLVVKFQEAEEIIFPET
jgi:hypothetical protein